MNETLRYSRLSTVVTIIILATLFGCSRNQHIEIESDFNPPPTAAFNQFDSYELRNVELNLGKQSEVHNEVLTRTQTELNLKIAPLVQEWNNSGSNGNRKLIIQPYIDQVAFVSTAKRLLTGLFAGNSKIIIRPEFIDANTGKLIAEPSFYQHSSNASGAYSFGINDKLMVDRTIDLMRGYMLGNYEKAVGGPTGKPRP